jgi:membrane protein required for colicin V production
MTWPPGWIDAVMLGVLGLSMLIGVVRGLVFELLSLLGWLVAWFAAQWGAPQLSPWLPVGTPGSALNHAAAFVAAFVLALIVWSLAARLVRLLIHATPLSVLDRLLGAGFGLLRGVVLLLALATVVAFTPLARAQTWQQSQGAAALAMVLRELAPLLPPDMAKYIPA